MAPSLRALGLTSILLLTSASAAPFDGPRKHGRSSKVNPFEILDPQNWVNPDNMTWEDYVPVPGVNWNDPSRTGSIRNFNIALIVVDYPDEDFVISQAANSTPFGNPQPAVNFLERAHVPSFYRDFLNKPQDLNRHHTLHEYWMEDSAGRFGVDLTSFGPYRLPKNSYQYGVDDEDPNYSFNPGACPKDGPCSVDLRQDAIGAWVRDVGNRSAESFELVFILSAGQDESSTWQEFGEMMFQTRKDVTEVFGPPDESIPNWAKTRYVEWTSWASAATIWPNAGAGSSTQGESSGMATYAHELSHLLNISDNYNNPYDDPPIRSFTGPWSMLSRGSFNGPGGPHTRWQIPAQQGGSLGSLHTIRDKLQIGLTDNSSVLMVSKGDLAQYGPIVATVTARSVDADLIGLRVIMGKDLSPKCNQSLDPFCDGGKYNNYDIEVIDRMGADSFTPDSGVMISKTKDSDSESPFQWTIDANPQDINVIDFYRPNGTASYISIGDYRQLADALFHAGTLSGSEYEYVDVANRLHIYIIDVHRDDTGVLSYDVGVRSLDQETGNEYGVELDDGDADGKGICSFQLMNTGATRENIPGTLSDFSGSEIYRLGVEVHGKGWDVGLANSLAVAAAGQTVEVSVGVKSKKHCSKKATVILTATSESDPTKSAKAKCRLAAT